MKSLRIYFAAFATAISFTVSVYAESFSREVTRDWPVGSFKKINLAVDAADVSVEGWDQERAQIILDMTINARNQAKADAAFDKWVLEIHEGEVLELHLKEQRSKWSWLAFWRSQASVNVRFYLPKDQTLDLATGAGDVFLNNVQSGLTCATGAGDVRATGFQGSLNIATGAGDVDVTGRIEKFRIATGAGDSILRSSVSPSSNSSIATGAGDIAIELPRSADFLLKASVGFGDISCDFPLLDLKEDKGSLVGYTSPDAPRISLDAGFGDVRVASRDWQE